jgi:hypothetical protein
MPVQFGGPIGPFLDNVQQRQVPVDVFGTFEYRANAPPQQDPAFFESWVKGQLLMGIKQVVGPRMDSGQLSFRDLGTGNVAALIPEIIGASGLQQNGIQIGNLTMTFRIDGHMPQQQAPQQQQQQPQQPQGPNLHANIRVAGLNINASSQGGLDTKGLQNQLANKAKSEITWWAIGCGVLLLVGIGLLGLGLYIWRAASTSMSSATSTSSAAAKWDGKSPFECGANDNVTINGVKANLSATAITAGGNCKLTLVNVNVTAPTAIEASGNAVVNVTGGSLNGSTFAVHAGGLAKVSMTGTTVTGKTQATAAAKITGP